MAKASGFFNSFLYGAATTGAAINQQRIKQQEELDAMRQKIALETDAKKQLMDYESARRAKALDEQSKELFTANVTNAVAQTPAAVLYTRPKNTDLEAQQAPVGALPVDDNAQPFPASSPVDAVDAEQAPVVAQPVVLQPQAAMPTAPQPGMFAHFTPEEQALAKQIALSKDISLAEAAMQVDRVNEAKFTRSPERKAEVAAAEEQAKQTARLDVANKNIKPIQEEAKKAREAGIPAPSDTYFNKNPDSRAKEDEQDAKALRDWLLGENKKGESYIRARGTISKLSALSGLQEDVRTGGLIWGNETVNALRTRFDADASLYDSLAKSLSIDVAKEVYPVSNTDMTILQKMSPTLESPEEANRAKIQMAMVANQGYIEENKFFNAYMDKWGTLNGAAMAYTNYMDTNPLLDSKKSTASDIVANDNRQTPEEFLAQGKREIAPAAMEADPAAMRAAPATEDWKKYKPKNDKHGLFN
jgi:hypothetical protein